MREIDVLVTIKYREDTDSSIEDSVEWVIDKLGEEFYNIGYDYDDLNVYTRVVERRQ